MPKVGSSQFWLGIGLTVSVVTILFHDAIFANTPQLFAGGAWIGNDLHDLAVAFIASWLFYLVVVFLPRRADQRNVEPFIQSQVMAGCFKGYIEMMKTICRTA